VKPTESSAQPVKTGPGIQSRLSMLVTVAVLVVMGLGGTLLVRTQADTMLADERERAAALVESLAVPCAIALATNDIERLDGYLEEVVQAGGTHLGMLHVTMLDYGGRVIAHSGPGGFTARADKSEHLPPTNEAHTFVQQAVQSPRPLWRRYRTIDGEPQLDISMPAVSGLRWGTLVAGFDLRPFEERLAHTRMVLVIAAVAFTLTMFLALYFGLHRIVVRPIKALTNSAKELEKGDLTARAHIDSSGELHLLANQLNSMASELQSYTESLEQKVEERSAEVREKNNELEQVNERLKAAVSKLEELARTDALTGISNRRFLMEILVFELMRSQRTPRPLSLLMIDVDHFKRVNDLRGHVVGDSVLQQLASNLASNLRSTDVVARYGGEEFVVLLFDTALDIAIEVADKIRQNIENLSFHDWDENAHGPITVSIGLAGYPNDAQEAKELIVRADRALYAAKQAGRNRVEKWGLTLSDQNS